MQCPKLASQITRQLLMNICSHVYSSIHPACVIGDWLAKPAQSEVLRLAFPSFSGLQPRHLETTISDCLSQ